MFDYVELKIMLSHWTGLEFQGGPLLLAKRFGFRWAFVGATAAVAVCLPFVGDLMGLIGEHARRASTRLASWFAEGCCLGWCGQLLGFRVCLPGVARL